MELTVRNIGSSKGIILNKTIIEKYNIKNKLELRLEDEQIVLKVPNKARQHWDKLFGDMHKNNDDTLLIDDVFDDEEFPQW